MLALAETASVDGYAVTRREGQGQACASDGKLAFDLYQAERVGSHSVKDEALSF
jgi:hypothetical protein